MFSPPIPFTLCNKNSVCMSNVPSNNSSSLILPSYLAKKIILRSPPSALSCTFVCYFFSLILLSTMLSYIPSYLFPKAVAMMIPPLSVSEREQAQPREQTSINLSLECRASCDETCVSHIVGMSRSETEVARISRQPDRT